MRGHWLGKPGAPTVLIYGHFDQQPADASLWESPPHELTKRGDRLYGRGAADDLGGWLSQVVAFKAWQETGGPPLNVRFLLEGEEEIGSPNLERYMEAYPEAFDAEERKRRTYALCSTLCGLSLVRCASPNGIYRTQTVPDDLTQSDVRLVGNYAIAIQFSDGHATGIYTYPYLRESDAGG